MDGKEEAGSTVLAETLIDLVNKEDVKSMVQVQRDMLSRYEKTNEMLLNFNILSATRYEDTLKDFKKHTQLLYDMKKDLDAVFRRIRSLKQRLGKMHPEAFAVCSDVYQYIPDEQEEEEEQDSATAASAGPTS